MKSTDLLLLLFCLCLGNHDNETVCSQLSQGINDTNETILDVQIFDRWVLKDVPRNMNNNSNKPKSSKTNREILEEMCASKPLERPDFKASGKRISIQKCDEYKWDREDRADEVQRRKACAELMRKHPILGGTPAIPGEFAHMGAIGWKEDDGTWSFKCGGTLISSKFVLTAGHCTLLPANTDPIPKIVRFTDIFHRTLAILEENLSFQRNISRIINHPKYNPPVKYFDVALMELDKEIQFYHALHPACLWPKNDIDDVGWEATITGWGVTDFRTKKTSPVLLKATVDIIESDECDELLAPHHNRIWSGVQDSQICAGRLEGGVDACQGDSGGPLQILIPKKSIILYDPLYYVIGVTSFAHNCGDEDTPGLYTRVSAVLDWIESVVWPGE